MSAVEASKPVYSGIVTARPTSEPSSASPRAKPGFSSRPISMTTRPKMIGTKIASDSQGKEECTISLAILFDQHKEGYQRQNADDHGKGVVVDVAGLHMARHRSHPTHYPRTTVDQETVYQATVASVPQTLAQQTRTTANDIFVDPVDVVLVLENVDHAAERTTNRCPCLRTVQAGIPGHQCAGRHQPERHSVEPVHGILDPAVEMRGDLGHGRMLGE